MIQRCSGCRAVVGAVVAATVAIPSRGPEGRDRKNKYYKKEDKDYSTTALRGYAPPRVRSLARSRLGACVRSHRSPLYAVVL